VLSLLLALGGVLGTGVPAHAAGGVLSGTLVDQVGDVVAGVHIDIYNNLLGGYLETVISDSNGDFHTSSLADEPNYFFWIHQHSTDGAGLEVGLLQTFFGISAGADVALGPVTIRRAVPVSGTITNWTPAMGNLRVQVYKPAGATWQQDAEANSTGATFSVPALLDDGQYSLRFLLDPASTAPNVDAFLGGEYFDVDLAQKFTAVAGTPTTGITMAMPPAALITGTVTDKVTGDPIANIWVSAESESGGDYSSEFYTGTDGTYVLRVVPGLTYSVYAEDTGSTYRAMMYDNLDPCGCTFTPVNPTLVQPSTGIDFALFEGVNAVFIEGIALHDSLDPGAIPFDNVRVHLYKPVSGGWSEVDVTSSDNSGAFELALPDFGSYRLRFEQAGLWLPVLEGFATPGSPFSLQPITGCYVDTGLVDASSVQLLGPNVSVAFFVAAGLDQTGGCGPEPTPSGSTPAGTSTSTTKHPHRPSSFSVAEAITPLVIPTPTPTATPKPSASPSDSASPTPAPTSAPTIPTSIDLTWLIWLIGALLAIGIVVTIVVLVRRR
jgi:hypothetical protein